jgi:hypothetical protein
METPGLGIADIMVMVPELNYYLDDLSVASLSIACGEPFMRYFNRRVAVPTAYRIAMAKMHIKRKRRSPKFDPTDLVVISIHAQFERTWMSVRRTRLHDHTRLLQYVRVANYLGIDPDFTVGGPAKSVDTTHTRDLHTRTVSAYVFTDLRTYDWLSAMSVYPIVCQSGWVGDDSYFTLSVRDGVYASVDRVFEETGLLLDWCLPDRLGYADLTTERSGVMVRVGNATRTHEVFRVSVSWLLELVMYALKERRVGFKTRACAPREMMRAAGQACNRWGCVYVDAVDRVRLPAASCPRRNDHVPLNAFGIPFSGHGAWERDIDARMQHYVAREEHDSMDFTYWDY